MGNVNTRVEYGETALHRASREGDIETLTVLIQKGVDVNAGDMYGQTALHVASRYGEIEVVRILIEKGVDINAVTEYGQTALHLASWNGKIEVVRILIEKGVDINAGDMYGQTALHLASFYGKIEVARILIEKGVDINAGDKFGQTALHYASWKGNIELVRILIEKGVDINASDKDGKTALQIASQKGYRDVVKLLQDSSKVKTKREEPVKKVKDTPESKSSPPQNTQTSPLHKEPVKEVKDTPESKSSPPQNTQTSPLHKTDDIAAHREFPPEVSELCEKIKEMESIRRKMMRPRTVQNAKSKTLQHFHYKLVKNLRPFPLIDHLFSRGVIDHDQLDILTRRGETEGRAAGVGKLLEIMRSSDKDDLGIFIECLEHEDVGYGELARELREYKPG